MVRSGFTADATTQRTHWLRGPRGRTLVDTGAMSSAPAAEAPPGLSRPGLSPRPRLGRVSWRFLERSIPRRTAGARQLVTRGANTPATGAAGAHIPIVELRLRIRTAIGHKVHQLSLVFAFILAFELKRAHSGALSDDRARRVRDDGREPGSHRGVRR